MSIACMYTSLSNIYAMSIYCHYLLFFLQSVLMLPVVHHAVFGAYTCIAENIHGKLEKVRYYLPISTFI